MILQTNRCSGRYARDLGEREEEGEGESGKGLWILPETGTINKRRKLTQVSLQYCTTVVIKAGPRCSHFSLVYRVL